MTERQQSQLSVVVQSIQLTRSHGDWTRLELKQSKVVTLERKPSNTKLEHIFLETLETAHHRFVTFEAEKKIKKAINKTGPLKTRYFEALHVLPDYWLYLFITALRSWQNNNMGLKNCWK